MSLDNRLAALRRRMVDDGLDYLLVTQPENRRYLSGFRERDISISGSGFFAGACGGGRADARGVPEDADRGGPDDGSRLGAPVALEPALHRVPSRERDLLPLEQVLSERLLGLADGRVFAGIRSRSLVFEGTRDPLPGRRAGNDVSRWKPLRAQARTQLPSRRRRSCSPQTATSWGPGLSRGGSAGRAPPMMRASSSR